VDDEEPSGDHDGQLPGPMRVAPVPSGFRIQTGDGRRIGLEPAVGELTAVVRPDRRRRLVRRDRPLVGAVRIRDSDRALEDEGHLPAVGRPRRQIVVSRQTRDRVAIGAVGEHGEELLHHVVGGVARERELAVPRREGGGCGRGRNRRDEGRKGRDCCSSSHLRRAYDAAVKRP
jgi:hypothetical protein